MNDDSTVTHGDIAVSTIELSHANTNARISTVNDDPQRRAPNRQVSSIDAPAVKTGVAGASSNLVNAIVGAGIIGIPFAIKESGFVIGVVLLILVGVFTDKSLRLIVDLATFHPKLKDLGVLTYEDLMAIPFGRAGKIFILVSMLILAYGAMVAYLLVVKDNVPDLLGLGYSFAERELVMLVSSLLIMLPLSMLRDISQLAFTSFLSVVADVVLVVIVCIYAPVSTTVTEAGGFGAVLSSNWVDSGLFIGLGVLSTALACQHSSFLISNTLEHHTSARWAKVTGISLVIATVLSLILGVVGYLGFLEETQGDVLKNFGQGFAVNAARALLSITMFLTYPMESFVARHVLGQLLFQGNMDNTSVGPNGEAVLERKFLGIFGRRERWTVYLYICALVPALIFTDLGPVLSLTGSLGASSIAYIAPGLVYLGVNGEDFLEWVGQSLQRKGHTSNRTCEVGELPVAGDAKATMETDSEIVTYHSKRKPCWWYLLGMPIWVAIASSGARGCQAFLTNLGNDVGRPLRGPSEDEDEIIGPKKSDYVYSVVFVVFGVVAAVAGVVSNIYVQVNNVFFSPS